MSPRVRVLSVAVGIAVVTAAAGPVPAHAAAKKRPDLVVKSVSASPGQVAPGGTLKVRDVTRNKGRKTAPKSVTRYVLSKDRKLDKRDVRLRERAVTRLKPRRGHAAKALTVRVPTATKPGTYWLLACADARKRVRESNERNNCRAARSRLTVTRAASGWPRTGWVQVDVSARVDVAYRSRSGSSGFLTVDEEDVRLDGTGTGWMEFADGRPASLTWTWSKAAASGTQLHDAQGQTDTDCRWDAYTRFSRSGPVDVRPAGVPAGGLIDFPGSKNGPRALFGLEHTLGSVETPRINCRGENIGNVSPVPTLQLRQYWWSAKPAYAINWSGATSRITWRQYGETKYTSPGGGSYENQSYQANGALTVKPRS